MTRVSSRFSQFATTLVYISSVLWVLTPLPALAQVADAVNPETIATDPPAHVSFVDGAAVLERDGQPDTAPANMPLLAGDRLRTQGGRVEVLFADGSTLHVDANTTLDFQSDELVRLMDGRIRLAIPGPDRRVSYRIDAASASALINQPGEYRLAVLHGAREAEIELAVIRGAAELVNDDGRTPLRAGERAYARADAAPSYAYVFNSAAWDSFDRWSEARRDQRLGVSTQYLPDEVRPYARSFDQYGAWRYEAAYGYVWYPTVSTGWRPYYNGRWVTMRPYGWTWVGVDPWAWPTHHYGRWGVSAGSWFWIPGRSWGPAWVSWAYAPGYVSWCPLGWNNRAVIQIVSGYGGYDPWRAWTAVPRRHFGVDYVNTHYVAGHTFDARTRGSFVPRYSAPASSGYAVPRSSAPIRVAGTARPRGSSSPVYTNLEPGASRVGQGGQRVIVGPARGSVADSPSGASDRGRAVARETAGDRGMSAGGAEQSRRASGVPGTSDRETTATRGAVSRQDPADRPSVPSSRAYGYGAERGVPVNPRADDARTPGVRETPYGRRAPDRSQPDMGAPPESRQYGRAAPRGPDAARPPAYGDRPYSSLPRTSPESARPAAPDPRPSGGIERRAPANDRPSSPPPESARPAPREYRSNPGAARSAPPSDNRSGPPPSQANPRSGGQSSGTNGGRRGGGR